MNCIIRINIFKSPRIYYFLLVLLVISFPIFIYPRIYGADAFQYIWMANTVRNGALFSENTWLIHPASYFGHYPFLYTPIGIPTFLALLISLLNMFSFGITEAILAFNIILIIIIYKSSRNLGNRLFEEEWSRFVFVAAVLLSPNVIFDTTMIVSTRIIITIIMIVLLNLNLKILSKDYNFKFKTTFFLFLLLLVGALSHRLWLGLVITIIFMIFTVFIRKYKKLQRLTVFLILPLIFIIFFLGLRFFYVDPRKIDSPFFDNSTLIGVSINLIIDLALKAGFILIFFPIGVIITLYKLVYLLKKSEEKREQPKNNNPQFLRKNFYLLLFIVPFSFMAPSFYAIVLFLPILIIFSVYGLIYIKQFISRFYKKLDWFFPMVVLFFSVGYSLLYAQMILRIDLGYMYVSFSIALFIYLVSVIVHKYNRKINSKFSFIDINNYKFRQGSEVLVIVFSFIIFSTTTFVGLRRTVDSSPYPWENRYLTEEEQEIINFFKNEDIFGLIYTNVPLIANRISGVGILPVFSDRYSLGVLYYGFISPKKVHEYTIFSLSNLDKLIFFRFIDNNPIQNVRRYIILLNVSFEGDLHMLQSEYNVQYIITGNETVLATDESLTLIQSLPTAFTPAFSTQHLLVWRIY